MEKEKNQEKDRKDNSIYCRNRNGKIQDREVSHIVPDFTIFVYDSSCNSLFFGLILSSFLSLCIPWHSVQHWGVPVSRKRKKRSKNDTEKRELHELPYTESVTSGGGVFEPFMGPKSQAELTPPRPGQLGR